MIATQQYPWTQFARRDGKEWPAAMDESMAMAKQSGCDAWEPAFAKPEEVAPVGAIARRYGLAVPSFYAGGAFHDDDADASIELVLQIAREARGLGSAICVVNPNPIAWDAPEDKNDAQLETQARALQRLAERLRDLGIVLAYHTHSPEMRAGARELHHMLVGTDPALVKFCLDTHWIYRGCGNSAIALYDIIRLHGNRVVELHLRQSHAGVWGETLEDGDIDYARVVKLLCLANVLPLLVIEQAIEAGTPQTMTPVEAHKRSVEYVQRVFAAFE